MTWKATLDGRGKLPKKNLLDKLLGLDDSRSTRGILSRGANVYKGGSASAHKGGGAQYGRPSKNAIQRRLRGK